MRVAAIFTAALLTCLSLHESSAAAERPAPAGIPVEDYALYDRVVTAKFLTSDTQLVLLERMTVRHLLPGREGSMSARFVREQGYFNGALPSDLVRDFAGANEEAVRLEGRFRFGVRYRFVSGKVTEEPEVIAALPVQDGRTVPTQLSPVLDRLAFSRVGRTLRNDQALLYVEQTRPDGTGAGFLVRFRRQTREWAIFETEVVWVIRDEPVGAAP